MLEREVDGSLNPVVMDFGLARESSENHGLTETGAVMGTPAYMAPEQARGETRLIDRRSDVYSLGATLYDLIVGIPPFDAESVMDILLKVISDDAKPLRSAVPSVPPDLETIVMKCLNKEPNQRYDSAKLLAEDLGRYIDGEPILGRRVSLAYRLRRMAQRHRTLVAVSAVFFVVLSGIVGSSIRQYFAGQRERARVAAQAQLERELTQQIKDLEWFLRTAYQLPLHDIGEEQALVRQRMAALPTPSAALGDLGVGLVHYARGRGHQALHETEPALKELRLAQQKGVDTQELHYALGRVLGDRYDQSMQEARRQGEKTWLEGRQKELEKEYLQPALAELERSRGLQLASPDYLDGLIAFYRKQYDQALDKARKAQSRARWWYEARQLEGDVLLARGTEQKEQGKYDEATKSLQAAVEAYKIASDIGRSDASIYESKAEAFIRQAEIAINLGKPPDQDFASALAAAKNAVVALPSSASGYLAESRVLFFSARATALKGKDPSEIYNESIRLAEKALTLDDKNFIAWDTLGNALNYRGFKESFSGKNPETTWQHAVESIRKAIAIAPNFPWAHNDLGTCYWSSGNYQRTHGHDPRERYQLAITAVERAIELDPKYLYAYANLVGILNDLADYSQEHGLDFPLVVAQAKKLTHGCGAGCASYVPFQQNIAAIHLTAAQHELRKGGDPSPALALSRAHLAALRELSKSSYTECLFSRTADVFEAENLLILNADPTEVIDRALRATPACRAVAQYADSYIIEARLLLIRAKWLERQGGKAIPAAQASEAVAVKAAEINPESDEAAQQKAYAAFLLARQIPESLREARLAAGVLAIEQGIKVKSDSGPMLALRAVLLRAAATTSKDAEAKADLQRRSEVSWKQALAINPLLEREYGPYLRDPWR